MKKLLILILSVSCLTFVLQTRTAHAINVQHFRPGTGAMKGYTLETSDTVQQGQFALGVVTNYAQHLLKIQPTTRNPNSQIVDELLMIDYLADVGIMDWLTLSIDFPMTGYHNIQQTPVSTADQGGAALGDLMFRLKFRFFDAEKTSSGLGLAFVPQMTVPTGSESVFVGDDGVTGGFVLAGDWIFYDVNRLYINGGYNWQNREVLGVGPGALQVNEEIIYGAGFTRPIYKPWDLDMIIEANGLIDMEHTSEERGYPLELLFLAQKGWMERHLVSTIGAGWGATEGYGTPNFRVILGLSYVSDPPSQQMKPAPLAHVEESRIVIDEKIHFQFDKAVIRPESYPVLDAVVTVMQDNPDIKQVEVAGYTDSVGSDAYNERLSDRRADAVEAYLVQHGVESDRLVSKGYGETNPIASNDTAEGRAANRRTEFHILERN